MSWRESTSGSFNQSGINRPGTIRSRGVTDSIRGYGPRGEGANPSGSTNGVLGVAAALLAVTEAGPGRNRQDSPTLCVHANDELMASPCLLAQSGRTPDGNRTKTESGFKSRHRSRRMSLHIVHPPDCPALPVSNCGARSSGGETWPGSDKPSTHPTYDHLSHPIHHRGFSRADRSHCDHRTLEAGLHRSRGIRRPALSRGQADEDTRCGTPRPLGKEFPPSPGRQPQDPA